MARTPALILAEHWKMRVESDEAGSWTLGLLYPVHVG